MLQNELDRAQTSEFVRGQWFTDDPDGFCHRTSQALLACEYANKWFNEEHSWLTPAQRNTIESCWHATLLTGAFDRHGCRFEDIVNLTNLETAGMLADITPDNRLPGPRRMLMHTSDLGQAKPCPQIIRLVQLTQEIEDARARFLNNPERERNWLREAVPELDHYVDALWRLGEYPSMRPEWQALKETSSTLCQLVDHWRQREAIIARLKDRGVKVKPPKKSKNKKINPKSPGGNPLGRDHPWYKD